MNNKLFNTLLLLSLFGIAMGFFGMLYEGITVIPKMLGTSSEKMQFWHLFYQTINPITYYIPVVPIATLILVVLYVFTPKPSEYKKWVGRGIVFHLITIALTIYIVTQINLKLYFSNVERYAAIIPSKTALINSLSIIRLIFSAIALLIIFKTYIKTQQIEPN